MDANNDLQYFRLMQAWKQNDNAAFNFYEADEIKNIYDEDKASIKTGLQESFRNSNDLIMQGKIYHTIML
jgi:hypothetical protein